MEWGALFVAAVTALAWLVQRPDRGLRPAGWKRRSRPPPNAGAGSGWKRLQVAGVTGLGSLVLTVGLGWWGVMVAGVVAAAGYLVSGRLGDAEQQRREQALLSELPQVCDLLAVAVEAGSPLRAAVKVLAEVLPGPSGQVMSGVVRRVELGLNESAAWLEVTAAEPALGGLGRDLARALENGTGLGPTLRAWGTEARRNSFAARELAARRVGINSVLPLMVCFLPAFLLLGVVPIIGGVVERLW